MLKKLHNLKSKKGFTLVELIIVIAIIAVLAAILIPTMMGFVKKSRITASDTTASQIHKTISIAITAMDEAGQTLSVTSITNTNVDSCWGTATGSGIDAAKELKDMKGGTFTVTISGGKPTKTVWLPTGASPGSEYEGQFPTPARS